MLHTPATTLEANHCQKGKQTYSHWLTLEQRNNLGDDVMHHSTLPLQALCPLPSAHIAIYVLSVYVCRGAMTLHVHIAVHVSQVHKWCTSTCIASLRVLQEYMFCKST